MPITGLGILDTLSSRSRRGARAQSRSGPPSPDPANEGSALRGRAQRARAVSALLRCPTCLVSHEASCLRHGLTDEQVHEAIRVAAVINAAAVALVSAHPRLCAEVA